MFRTILTLLLALCIMLSSVGVALSNQLCLMAGMKMVSPQGQTDNCCHKPSSKNTKDNCCKVKVSFEKLEPVATLKQFHLKAPLLFPPAPQEYAPLRQLIVLQDHRLFTYSDSSPPLSGRKLLHFIQVLIV
jgi:hypothetical protein